MLRKVILLSILFLSFSGFVLAQEKIEVNFFYSKTCPHCAEEKSFLENEIINKYPRIELNKFSISENVDLLKEFYKEYGVSSREHGLVPVTFIEGSYFVGFSDQIGSEIEEYVSNLSEGKEPGIISEKNKVSLPFLGKIDVSKYSLPALSVVLGFFDGFNVCSLGALVLILTIVLSLKEKKKIFLYGTVFVATTAFIYGLLIIVWHQIFSFLASYLRGMEIIIGVIGVLGGVYFFREFLRFRKYGPTCQSGGAVSKFSSKIKKTLQESESIFLIVLSILAFAAAITIVEFPCSAAIPVFFASILADAGLSPLLYLLFIAVFVFFYMLDEIIIFLIAFFTMKIRIASPRFTVWITLIESLFLFALGIFYLFGL